MRRPTRVIGIAAPALGVAYGAAVVRTFPQQNDPLWLVWAAFAVADTTAAGFVFAYGWNRWDELSALYPVPARKVALPVTVIAAGGLILTNITVFFRGASHLSPRNTLVDSFAIVGAVPAAAVMLGIWRAAADAHPSGKRGEQLDLLLALRRLLRRLVAAVGSLVALTTFAGGTLLALERSVHAPFGNRPPQFVLIFGAVGSLLVAVVYAPAWTALQRRGQRLCDEMFPVRDLDEGAAILRRAGDRRTLEQILGIDRGIFADLQDGIIILAPLLAGAVAAFLPH